VRILLEVPTDSDLRRGIAALGGDPELAPAADFLRAELLRRTDLRRRLDLYLEDAGPYPPELAARRPAPEAIPPDPLIARLRAMAARLGTLTIQIDGRAAPEAPEEAPGG
jgi:hypothetical protein